MNKRRFLQDSRGFSLLEVLLGISVFMVGMLGVTALNISSLKSNTFSGNLSEATLIAATKIEELLAMDFDDTAMGSQLFDVDNDGNCQSGLPACSSPVLNQDTNDDGIDDDAAAPGTHDDDDNFGLDDTDGDADYAELDVGKLGMYDVYWNVAENEPITVTPQRTKTIRVIVVWSVKGERRRISMDLIRMKEA